MREIFNNISTATHCIDENDIIAPSYLQPTILTTFSLFSLCDVERLSFKNKKGEDAIIRQRIIS